MRKNGHVRTRPGPDDPAHFRNDLCLTCSHRHRPFQSYMARLATAVVLGSTHMAKGQNDTLVATNYAACEAYMTDLKTAFASAASMAEVKDIAYDQYMQNPSGPYVFCWTRTPEQVEDDASAMILSVHPYLDPVSLGELVQGNEPEYIEDKERVLLENLLNPTGSFFNYSETFNQVATQQADLAGTDKIDTTGQEQMILGFIEEDPSDPDLLVNCGCRFTGGMSLTQLRCRF